MEIEKKTELTDEELGGVIGGAVDVLNAEMNEKGEWVYDRGLCSCAGGKLVIDHSDKKYDYCKCSSCSKKMVYNRTTHSFSASKKW